MDKDIKNDEIITSHSLHDELNDERRREGKSDLPEINACSASSGNLARKDTSWNSVPGFFAKLVKGEGKEDSKDE